MKTPQPKNKGGWYWPNDTWSNLIVRFRTGDLQLYYRGWGKRLWLFKRPPYDSSYVRIFQWTGYVGPVGLYRYTANVTRSATEEQLPANDNGDQTCQQSE